MKTLGLDIGTNSIGWGIVDESAQKIEKCGILLLYIKKRNQTTTLFCRGSFCERNCLQKRARQALEGRVACNSLR